MHNSALVLVVDEDAVSRVALVSVLSAASLRSVCVASHKEALAWIQEHKASLVVLHLGAPLSGGYEVLGKLRAQPGMAELPIVIVKKADTDEEAARALEAGADDFLCQPFHPAELIARIRSQLRTAELSVARGEAERRLRAAQRYADFFESTADGIVVIDIDRCVLFSNPRARVITGCSESELQGKPLYTLLASEDVSVVDALMAGLERGHYSKGVDLHLKGNSQRAERVTLSANFSALREDKAVLITFRDVTQERSIEEELRKTKSFLERVIESSVDVIISADLRGNVLLFNRAAERCYGYTAEEVVGKISVEALYPPGVARAMMRLIRKGQGQLESYRAEVVTKAGEPVPVSLSAALIYEGDQPVGSVGIFTDLRDRIRMETRLLTAQEELKVREKQAIVAELAGAAAHELNQPLTSVMGYAELLKRRLDRESQAFAAAEVIVNEAERMAEIVRKIGKITRYETKSYVGQAKILDLDKASEESSGGEPSPPSSSSVPPASAPPLTRLP